jgi:hypothetical protein
MNYPKRERHPVPPSRRKWNRSDAPIASIEELCKLLEAGYYIFVAGRSSGYHPSVVSGWPLRYVLRLLKAWNLFPGTRNPQIPFVWTADWCPVTQGPKRSCYLVTCDELNSRGERIHFELTSRDSIMARALEVTRLRAGDSAKCVVQFNDESRR